MEMKGVRLPLLIYSVCVMLIISCTGKKESIPFPVNDSEFSDPVKTPLQFSEPKKTGWIVNDPVHVKPPLVRKVNFEKLPAKPFYPNGFIPLKAPTEEIKFDFDHLPDTLIDNLIYSAFQAVGEVENPKAVVSTQNSSSTVARPDAIKDKILQPFFTIKPTGQGTKVGLSLAYDIVKAHGEEITGVSMQGEGTKFIIQMPGV